MTELCPNCEKLEESLSRMRDWIKNNCPHEMYCIYWQDQATGLCNCALKDALQGHGEDGNKYGCKPGYCASRDYHHPLGADCDHLKGHGEDDAKTTTPDHTHGEKEELRLLRELEQAVWQYTHHEIEFGEVWRPMERLIALRDGRAVKDDLEDMPIEPEKKDGREGLTE